MDTCFVIQPFDKDKFDKRFVDVFEPAITKGGLRPYRVDRDFGVTIPIEDIENGIAESAMCFAEITTDNPNVWYELGFAFACGKEVIIVCAEERIKFPFDIQHRHIIIYKTGSKSDYEELEQKIISKIGALRHKAKTITKRNKIQTGIEIISATYGADGDNRNILNKINELVANGILEFRVGNWLVNGPEPMMGKEKTLELQCVINGNPKVIVKYEREVLKIE